MTRWAQHERLLGLASRADSGQGEHGPGQESSLIVAVMRSFSEAPSSQLYASFHCRPNPFPDLAPATRPRTLEGSVLRSFYRTEYRSLPGWRRRVATPASTG
jgi:hypothetical protein